MVLPVPLRVAPCRTLCDWGPTRAREGGRRLFACTGCGAQWASSEPWTPRQLDGSWPPGVREELAAAASTALSTTEMSTAEPAAEGLSTGPAGGAVDISGS